MHSSNPLRPKYRRIGGGDEADTGADAVDADPKES